MASAKAVKMITLQDYEAPQEAIESAMAEFGQIEEAPTREFKRDPGRPDTIGVVSPQQEDGEPGEPPPDHWIGVKLVDNAGEPIAFQPFRLKLGDGSILEGTLDEKGYCRVEGVEKGTTQVSFPNINADEWKSA